MAASIRRLLSFEDEDTSSNADDSSGGGHGDDLLKEDDASMSSVSFLTSSVQPPSKHKHLSSVEVAALSSLSSTAMLKVIEQLKGALDSAHVGNTATPGPISLTEILQSIEPDVVDKAKQAVESQYATIAPPPQKIGENSGDDDSEESSADGSADAAAVSSYIGQGGTAGIAELTRIAKITPLRIRYEERVFLRLLESTLEVSEYTDKVDILLGKWSPAKKMAHEIKQICAVLSGLVVAHKYELGQQLIKERDFKVNAEFFRQVFEIGRRYKILNPERMRDNYGKLVYFLMDSRRSDVADMLEFDCVTPIQTVYGLLSRRKNGLALLSDPLIRLATAEIMPEGKTRQQVQWEISKKEAAIKQLATKYGKAVTTGGTRAGLINGLSRITSLWSKGEPAEGDGSPDQANEVFTCDEVEQCLYSLCDHNTFLRFNREPCDKLIEYLKRYFHPSRVESGYDLSVYAGRGGARLTHKHDRQYLYVLQSLTLWREVLHEMLGLWTLAERDLLNQNNPYRLRDTGQGLNRVQQAPNVYKAMSTLLRRVQQEVGGWCGSSVIHLGDHNVPNALTFIDKYVQVPRILGPIVLCLEKIPELYNSTEEMKTYIDDSFGGEETLIKIILSDFFRHAFDGSGADNFFDAGSCIDGRLTSAWNWCSKIEKKAYFPIFLLCGFTGFDGRFG